jgi:hypothetical protein
MPEPPYHGEGRCQVTLFADGIAVPIVDSSEEPEPVRRRFMPPVGERPVSLRLLIRECNVGLLDVYDVVLPLKTGFASGLTSNVTASEPMVTTTEENAKGCIWGPITDVPAAQLVLDKWAAATNLSPFDKNKSGLSIAKDSARLTLVFAKGVLTLDWMIDEDCNPTAITIQPSPDYEGTPPDEDAVNRLVSSLRGVISEQRNQPSAFVTVRVRFLIVGLGFAGLLLFYKRWNSRR